MLYFAYGANLNNDGMAWRCPSATPIKSLVIKDWRLVFRGVADIEPSLGDQVQGVLWDITAQCEKALDRFEGYPNLYTKDYFTVSTKLDSDGNVLESESVLVYRMLRVGYGMPMSGYYDTIKTGYLEHGLDSRYLDQAVHHSIDHKEQNPYIQKRFRDIA